MLLQLMLPLLSMLPRCSSGSCCSSLCCPCCPCCSSLCCPCCPCCSSLCCPSCPCRPCLPCCSSCCPCSSCCCWLPCSSSWPSFSPISLKAIPGRTQKHHPVKGFRSFCCCRG